MVGAGAGAVVQAVVTIAARMIATVVIAADVAMTLVVEVRMVVPSIC